MRILFCNFEYPPLGGGGGVINALLAEELATRHEVAVLTSQSRGQPAEEEVNGVRLVRVPVLFRRRAQTANLASMLAYMVRGVNRGRCLLRMARFDLINTHFVLPSGPVGDALARRAGLPNVLSLHGGDLYDPSKWTSPHRHPLLRVWVRRILRRADHVIGQSANTIANVRRFYAPELAVTRIPLGIRRPSTGRAARADYGFAPGNVLLVTIGRLIPRKALPQLLELMTELPAWVQLVIVGSGPEQPELQRRAAALGMGDRVRFLGHVTDTDKFHILRLADLYVSTSQHEGFGLVFLEAMACGLPVICYDHGGQTDFLESGVTGEVIRVNERAAFARAVRALIDAPEVRRRMGAECQARVQAYYIDRCARQYETVFEQVVRAGPAGIGASREAKWNAGARSSRRVNEA